MKIILFLFFVFLLTACYKTPDTPLELNKFQKLTSYEELISFLNTLEGENELIQVTYFTESHEGRKIPLVKFSKSDFGKDSSKLKVMIFAQQHGKEHSGKEGSLLFLSEAASGKLDYLFDKLDLMIIPQVNPDGSEVNKRRNSRNMDLNRNHLILSEKEVIGLHGLFWKYLPEATLDIHEYYPYGESWYRFGYLKNFDEQLGTLTNPNIPEEIIRVQKDKLLPFFRDYLSDKGFTSNEYLLGGPPDSSRMRFSTIDVNDGRQGFGILNTFSLILEGKNGRDSLENMPRRAEAQKESIKAYLNFLSKNYKEIKGIVREQRDKLMSGTGKKEVAVRLEHVNGNQPVSFTLVSALSGRDTTVTIDTFHTKIASLLDVKKPDAYLVPRNDSALVSFLNNHGVKYSEYLHNSNYEIEQYTITKMEETVEEEDIHLYPSLSIRRLNKITPANYYFVPLNQLSSTLLVIAFEPQSMLGIGQYPLYRYLLEGKYYPILRVQTLQNELGNEN